MFNILTVMVLLPLEMGFGMLEISSEWLVTLVNPNSHTETKEPELLNTIIKPLIDFIVQIDKSVLDAIASNKTSNNVGLIKRQCGTALFDLLTHNETTKGTPKPCKWFITQSLSWPEWVIGLVLIGFSLLLLTSCLILMVKILGSIFQGTAAKIIHTTINSDLPGIFKHFTGLLAITVSACFLNLGHDFFPF